MQPDQPQNSNRYDFFLNPLPPPKKSVVPEIPGVRNPFMKRILVIVGGGIGIIIVAIILASVILGGKTNTASLLTIAQQQNELIRVSTNATTFATVQTTKNLAVNSQLTLTTDQQSLLAYLKAHGSSVNQKKLVSLTAKTTDQQLANAKAASNYDHVYVQIMQSQLTSYATALKQAFTGSSNTKEKKMINTEYQTAALLLKQANDANSALQGQ